MKHKEFSISSAQKRLRTSAHDTAGFYGRFGKRTVDILLALALLPILVPVVAILWLIVRSDGGPGFYGHLRVGQDGVAFRCWKLRSMCVDSDERLTALLENDKDAAAQWQRDHKLENDPRITRLGSFIRKTSLDELPQIWNVLSGDMSFVGPRPVVEGELERYGAYQPYYLAMKPGVTGVWQVSGRNNVSYDERVRMDVAYAGTNSCFYDLYLIARTLGAVVGRTGA